MRYLITGSEGQLGYDIIRELKKRGINDNNIIAPTLEEMDITDIDQVENVVLASSPDIIFHCAAWTNVDLAEEKEDLVYKVNVEGTKNLVEMAREVGAKIIYISTDYVFDGKKEGIYDVKDMPNPLGVYGKTKFLGEVHTMEYSKSFIVRVSWVFGINGNNFVKKMLELAQTKDELNIVSDQIGSPTYTVDLAKLLVDMSETEKYGIYHATNSGYCSWAEFAKYIFETNNLNVKVNEIKTSDYKTKAERPLNSKLDKQILLDKGFYLLPEWKDAIIRYNEELKTNINTK
ncbi:MAG TPA: dTDP-4-dehydrorhamnose reductase [Tenericutes bacterium]|nr:dTDP-4-dehydrorhamnose reductase [Mycoplasmatota bacterium]